jgi:hypothetical protein
LNEHKPHTYIDLTQAHGAAAAELDAAIEAAVLPLSAAEAGKAAVKEQLAQVEAIGVRCAFSADYHTRGCHWIPRMFA